MLVAKLCRAGVSPGLASLVRTPVVPITPQFSKGQIARLFVNDGRSAYTRTTKRRATVAEQATAPAGKTGIFLSDFYEMIIDCHVYDLCSIGET